MRESRRYLWGAIFPSKATNATPQIQALLTITFPAWKDTQFCFLLWVTVPPGQQALQLWSRCISGLSCNWTLSFWHKETNVAADWSMSNSAVVGSCVIHFSFCLTLSWLEDYDPDYTILVTGQKSGIIHCRKKYQLFLTFLYELLSAHHLCLHTRLD